MPVPRSNGLAALRPGTIPVLIAGCEPGPLALQASLRITPEALPSTYQTHQAELSFVNPYDQPVTGQVRLEAPEGWTISPRVARFSMGPYETWKGKLEIMFPYNEPAGLKRLNVGIVMDARRTWSVTAPAFFYLALEGVECDIVQATAAQDTLEVRQVITNDTDHTMNFDCFVQVPDQPRQNRVAQLRPGGSAVKLFRFPNASGLRGQTLHAGLREADGPAILNQTAVIE